MSWLQGFSSHLMPHLSTEWVEEHATTLVAHAAAIQIMASIVQACAAIATLFVMGGIMWMQWRAQCAQVLLSEKTHGVTEKTYGIAQIQKDIAYSQYETGMTQIRWRVWRNYDDQVSSVLDQVRAVLQEQSTDRDAALSTYSQLHSAGYQLVWTFGEESVGQQVSGIDQLLAALVRTVCTNFSAEEGKEDFSLSLSYKTDPAKGGESLKGQIKVWEENAPRITAFLDEIVQKIGPFMRIKDPFLTSPQISGEGGEHPSDSAKEEAV